MRPKQALALWESAATGVPPTKLWMPLGRYLEEAIAVVAFLDQRWTVHPAPRRAGSSRRGPPSSSSPRPGLSRLANDAVPGELSLRTGDEILQLVLAIRGANELCRDVPAPQLSPRYASTRKLLADLHAPLAWIADAPARARRPPPGTASAAAASPASATSSASAMSPGRRAMTREHLVEVLGRLKREIREKSSLAAYAQHLVGYVELSKEWKPQLEEVGAWDAGRIARATELQQSLLVGVSSRVSERQKRSDLRDRLITLLRERVGLVRSAALVVFRDEPEIRAEAASRHDRLRRRAKKKPGAAKPAGGELAAASETAASGTAGAKAARAAKAAEAAKPAKRTRRTR